MRSSRDWRGSEAEETRAEIAPEHGSPQGMLTTGCWLFVDLNKKIFLIDVLTLIVMPSAGIITRFTLILLALGGPGPTANSVRCQGGRADERVDEAGPPVPAELLSRQPEQSGQSGSPADLRTVNTLH